MLYKLSCQLNTHGTKSFKTLCIAGQLCSRVPSSVGQLIGKFEMEGPVSTDMQICSVSSLLCMRGFVPSCHF